MPTSAVIKPQEHSEESANAAKPATFSESTNGTDRGLLQLRPLTILATVAIIGLLFFGRQVFIPLSLAMLLSFLLAIPCGLLERRGLPRTAAVFLTVGFTFMVLAGFAWLITSQFYDLASKLPGYHNVIEAKLSSFENSGSAVGRMNTLVTRLVEELHLGWNKTLPAPAAANPSRPEIPVKKPEPVPVEIKSPASGSVKVLWTMLSPVLSPLGTCLIVMVVLIFMLQGREDLRDRFIRLVGTDRMDSATQALDQVAFRVSRYLLMQLIVNCCFGILLAAGLYLIGVPTPWLWGVLAMVLRFIPYVGPWIAASAPCVLAFATDPGWSKLSWTATLFVTAEIVTANIIEPWLYGSSTGVTPIALLMGAVFWTWLWGPVGLLLSTPLTVCLMVAGLHVPHWRVLHILLGDEPVLPPEARLYQRLLALDRIGAEEILEEFLKTQSLSEAHENLLVPTLVLVKADLARGRFDREKENFILESIAELLEEMGQSEPVGAGTDEPLAKAGATKSEVAVVIIPAKDKADEIAGKMLSQELSWRSIAARVLPSYDLVSSNLEVLTEAGPKVVCISSVPPTGLRRTRYLCKRLRLHHPETNLVVGLWHGTQDQQAAREKLNSCQPNSVLCSFEEAVAAITSLINVEPPVAVQPTP